MRPPTVVKDGGPCCGGRCTVKRKMRYAPEALAASIARQTRIGVAGMSSCLTPMGRNASRMAFMTAGGPPVVPASPMPFTPRGLV